MADNNSNDSDSGSRSDVSSNLDFLEDFSKKIQYPEFLNGFNGKVVKPENMTDKNLNSIIRYALSDSGIEDKLIDPYTDKEVYAVAIGAKRVAMLDNDLPMEDVENVDTKLRYALLLHGKVKVIFDKSLEDPTAYYYQEKNWPYAMLLYMYHNDFFDKNEFKFDRFDFDIFQSYLLGYSKDSLIYYILGEEENSFGSFLKKSKKYDKMKKDISSVSKEDKLDVYKKFYKANEIVIKELNNRYDKIVAMCEEYVEAIKENKEYQIFALGLNNNKKFTLQKKTESKTKSKKNTDLCPEKTKKK